jgi:hypothetical protein
VRRRLVIAVAAIAACAFAGGAYAATSSSGVSPRQAFLNDAAKRLGVTPQRLKDALAGALQDELAAAVRAGKLTQAQASAIERHFKQSGGLPLPLGPNGGLHALRFGPGGGPLGAAARYLGLSVPQLLDQLRGGKSLALLASSRGKSTSGLENAIVSDERARLDKARAAGAITASREQKLLAQLRARVDALVNRSGGLPRFGRRQGPGPGRPPGPPGGSGSLVVPAPPLPGADGPPAPPSLY